MAQATQKTSEYDINQLNLAMRQTPWYQDFFKSKGLDANRVKLDNRQRQELTQLASQNGYQIGDRMKFDQAGNINQQGGFAGMPTWAKIAIAAAPIAATAGFGAAGIGPMAGLFGAGGGGVGAAGTGAGLAAAGGAPTAASTGMGLALGSGAFPTTAALGAGLPTIGSTAIGGAAMAGPSLTGASTVGGLVGGGGGGSSLLSGGLKKAGGSVINRLMGGDSSHGQSAADIGKMFEDLANQEARKRGSDFEMSNRYNKDAISAQQDRRTQESDAMKKIQQAGYIKSGGSPFDASQVKLAGGRELPSFSFPRAPITDEAKQAAGMLEKTMLERLGPNGSFTPTPVEQYQDRGTMENVGRWGDIAARGFGQAPELISTGKKIWDIFT